MYNVGLLMYKTYHLLPSVMPLLYTINFNYIVLLTVAHFQLSSFNEIIVTHTVYSVHAVMEVRRDTSYM